MSKPTFEEIIEKYRAFLAERDWGKKEPKNFAISISFEANELLEHFQWSDDPVGTPDELAAELADIIMYCIQFADVYNIDIPSAIAAKMKKSGEKYPAADFKGKSSREQRESWRTLKKQHVKKESL